jgi:hypothetical protein
MVFLTYPLNGMDLSVLVRVVFFAELVSELDSATLSSVIAVVERGSMGLMTDWSF